MQALCQLSYSPRSDGSVSPRGRLAAADLFPWRGGARAGDDAAMRDPAIAEATADDVDDLRAFLWEAWAQAGPDAPGWAGADDEVMGELTAPDAILARLGGPDRRLFLARRDGRVAGFAATRRIDPATVELAGVIVLQTMIGQGVGGGLVDAAVAGAIGDGCPQMVVRTEADNDRSRAFYRRHGFVEVGFPVEPVEGVGGVLVELRRDVG